MSPLRFQVTVCVVCQDVMEEKEDVRVWGTYLKRLLLHVRLPCKHVPLAY